MPLRERMFPVARKMLSHAPHEAEDAVQEALIRLWTMRSSAMQYDSVEALAVTITRNICIDHLRQRRQLCTLEEVLGNAASADNPHRALEAKDTNAALSKIIAQLPTLQQAVLRLKDVEGYEVSEIAAITGTQPEAVRMNLSRARKKVREEFTKLMG
jgi:RNA polymerase sigma-70 factor (ECF subfamily)